MNSISKVVRSQQSLFSLSSHILAMRSQPKPFESSRYSDASRHEDTAPPTEDDMISNIL